MHIKSSKQHTCAQLGAIFATSLASSKAAWWFPCANRTADLVPQLRHCGSSRALAYADNHAELNSSIFFFFPLSFYLPCLLRTQLRFCSASHVTTIQSFSITQPLMFNGKSAVYTFWKSIWAISSPLKCKSRTLHIQIQCVFPMSLLNILDTRRQQSLFWKGGKEQPLHCENLYHLVEPTWLNSYSFSTRRQRHLLA